MGLCPELYPCRPLADAVSSGGHRGLWARRLRDPWVAVSSVGSGLRARAKAWGCNAASSQAPMCLSLRENSRGNTGIWEMTRAPPRPWVSSRKQVLASEPGAQSPGAITPVPSSLAVHSELLAGVSHGSTIPGPRRSPVTSPLSLHRRPILPPTRTSGPHLLKIFQ